MKKYFKKNNKLNKGFNHQNFVKKISGGFTLVETLVAISIFSMSIITMMSILGSGLSDTNYAKKKIIAGYLAQEGIEYIRNMRDTYVLYPQNGTTWASFKIPLNPCNSGNECGFNTTNPTVISKCASLPGVCKIYLSSGNYNTNSSGSDTGFTRKIWMDVITQDEVKIYSEVEWDKGSHNITLTENLFNWVE